MWVSLLIVAALDDDVDNDVDNDDNNNNNNKREARNQHTMCICTF